ncbi:putative baseplate assembly protein [Duganella sp. HH101]|uniref:putative baseplate assembly protein n=1 Tax=Duganella sp. HH101 TaxID=1781066 RepID=UPI000875058E|nr:putative baseplate assembly protein [Duganella sp. HH101]OFA06907.1 hypothetical protein DUGA2_02390 [Duganella sp. HH101]
MIALAPDYFDRRFDDLMEIGRSRLPGMAPGWTDYNLHDPGITLLELMAWVTEAQLYALSRMRRDERTAYAALLGLGPRGPLPAHGFIWPEAGPARYTRSLAIDAGAVVVPEQSGNPAYRSVYRQLWLAAVIRAVRTIGADGKVRDHTATNERANVVFLPFGDSAGSNDVLSIDIACPAGGGLFPERRSDAERAFLIVGVRADATSGEDGAAAAPVPLQIALNDGAARHSLRLVDDTSAGFTSTGVLVLDVSGVAGSPAAFALEFRAPGGFPRPPRVSRIALNVMPVRQGSLIEQELHIATGLPDQVLKLQQQGLEFAAGAEAVKVQIEQDGLLRTWSQRSRLDDAGPRDSVYVLDPLQATITFGNGINGSLPPPGAQILLTYVVCDGVEGNAMRNQRWKVKGFDGVYGLNPDPMLGGLNGFDRADQRREARRRVRDEHALVTASDLEAAALALPALEVARALVPAAPSGPQADRGIANLVAMRLRIGGVEPDETPETARWLRAVQRALAPRLPLGRRLQVQAPRYVPFHIALEVEAMAGYRETVVETAIKSTLQDRLALTARQPGGMQRDLGLGVTQRDLTAWIRKVEGVARILSLKLFDADNHAIATVAVPRLGLPKFVLKDSVVTVRRPAPGSTR